MCAAIPPKGGHEQVLKAWQDFEQAPRNEKGIKLQSFAKTCQEVVKENERLMAEAQGKIGQLTLSLDKAESQYKRQVALNNKLMGEIKEVTALYNKVLAVNQDLVADTQRQMGALTLKLNRQQRHIKLERYFVEIIGEFRRKIDSLQTFSMKAERILLGDRGQVETLQRLLSRWEMALEKLRLSDKNEDIPEWIKMGIVSILLAPFLFDFVLRNKIQP